MDGTLAAYRISLGALIGCRSRFNSNVEKRGDISIRYAIHATAKQLGEHRNKARLYLPANLKRSEHEHQQLKNSPAHAISDEDEETNLRSDVRHSHTACRPAGEPQQLQHPGRLTTSAASAVGLRDIEKMLRKSPSYPVPHHALRSQDSPTIRVPLSCLLQEPVPLTGPIQEASR